jgi:hypothetical protein
VSDTDTRLAEALAEIERLRARQQELESVVASLLAQVAVIRGSLAMAKPTPDEPTRFTWNVPPSTPPMEIP